MKKVILALVLWVVGLPMISTGESMMLDSSSFSRMQKAGLRSKTPFSSQESPTLISRDVLSYDMTLPFVIEMPQPIRYPRWARREGFQGQLLVSLEILETGSVGRWRVEKSTGDERLDQHTVETLRTWKFHPAMSQGKSFATYIEVPVNFELIRD